MRLKNKLTNFKHNVKIFCGDVSIHLANFFFKWKATRFLTVPLLFVVSAAIESAYKFYCEKTEEPKTNMHWSELKLSSKYLEFTELMWYQLCSLFPESKDLWKQKISLPEPVLSASLADYTDFMKRVDSYNPLSPNSFIGGAKRRGYIK